MKMTGDFDFIKASRNDADEIFSHSDAREIARVSVLPEYQGNSYALGMVYALEDIIRTEGYSSVHLLAAKKYTGLQNIS